MAVVAFIGLGNLGLPMAANVASAGHEIVGYDIVPAALDAGKKLGFRTVTSAAEAVQDADFVITMVPSGKELRALFIHDNIAAAATRPDVTFIDCSTVDLPSAAACKEAAHKQGHTMLDAPVSGGAPRARSGELSIMVGGSEDVFLRAEPLLQTMASNVMRMGADGSGLATKLCNNMIAGVTLAAVSEAYALAQKLGIDEQKFFDVVSRSSGQCWALTEMCPVPGPVPTSPANHDFKPGGAAKMLVKDLGMAQEAGFALGAATPMTAAAYNLYSIFCSSGRGDMDVSAIIKLFQEG